jgi:hypothetical protein
MITYLPNIPKRLAALAKLCWSKRELSRPPIVVIRRYYIALISLNTHLPVKVVTQ